MPGWTGGDYRGHGRPKDLLVRLAQRRDGTMDTPIIRPTPEAFLSPDPGVQIIEYHLTLDDAPRWQFLRLEEPAIILAFQVVVESVYPGERYDDVAIAEVLFPVFEQDLVAPPLLPGTGGADGRGDFQLAILALGSGAIALGMAVRAWAGRGSWS